MSSPVTSKTSDSENCGFACHVFVVILSVLYLLWIIGTPEAATAVGEEITDWEIASFVPNKSWSVTGPAFMVVLFFAVMGVYGLMNALSVPPINSTEILTDRYARPPPDSQQENHNGLPPIYDMDVATVNDLVWNEQTERTIKR